MADTIRHAATPYGHDHAGCAAHGAGTVKDPVCGMDVDPATAPHRARHDGAEYFFCSAGCRTKFLADPGPYLDRARAAAPAQEAPAGAIYTCPMHPEVRQVGPGSCPICGMALEPVVVTREAEPNAELIDMTRRFWIGPSPRRCRSWSASAAAPAKAS